MRNKILVLISVLLVAFAIFVHTRPGTFRYERSGVIAASASDIFPYLSQFKLGNQWSPYEMKDPAMKRTFSGPETGVGSVMEFEGNSDVGAGRLEITRVEAPSLVEVQLSMTQPMKAENTVQYRLTPEGTGTRFTWSMFGKVNFLGKFVSVLIDCDKMVAGDFEKGILNLKRLVESQKTAKAEIEAASPKAARFYHAFSPPHPHHSEAAFTSSNPNYRITECPSLYEKVAVNR